MRKRVDDPLVADVATLRAGSFALMPRSSSLNSANRSAAAGSRTVKLMSSRPHSGNIATHSSAPTSRVTLMIVSLGVIHWGSC